MDAHIDGHLDAHADGDLPGDVDGDAGHHLHAPHKELHTGTHDTHHGNHESESSGWLGDVARFVNLGEVPLMVVLSVIALSLWMGSLLANHYFTGHNPVLAIALLIPNLVVAIVVTRYVTMPLRPVFRMLRRDGDDAVTIVGQLCRITSRAGEHSGQAEIELPNAAPLLINVRTLDGAAVAKGESAVVVRENAERGLYYVVPVRSLAAASPDGESKI
jgi:hypothetical protein